MNFEMIGKRHKTLGKKPFHKFIDILEILSSFNLCQIVICFGV